LFVRFAVLGFKLSGLALNHFAFLFVFQIGSHALAQADLNRDPPISASQIAGITGLCHHTQPLTLVVGASLKEARLSCEVRWVRCIQ
jgi:hypothetical protein